MRCTYISIEHMNLHNGASMILIMPVKAVERAGGQIKLMVLREEDVDGQEADSHSLASGSDVNASSWVNINCKTLLCVLHFVINNSLFVTFFN